MIPVAIPMRNYSRGVHHLLDWWEQQSDVPHEVTVYNDRSDPHHIDPIRERATVVDVPDAGALRWAYKHAAEAAQERGLVHVLTCESDALPRRETLDRILLAAELYPEAIGITGIPSVPGTDEPCYPSNYKPSQLAAFKVNPNPPQGLARTYPVKPWQHPKHHKRLGWHRRPDVTMTFLFTLFRTDALIEIDDKMPDLYVDGALAHKLRLQGRRDYIELLDVFTGHAGCGQQTRRRTGDTTLSVIRDDQS